MSLIQELADAITRHEGYYPGSRAYRNNNPGNIWDGIGAGKTTRIWPQLPIDDKGFVIYPTPEAGRAALERDLQIKVDRGWSLEKLISVYAPASENDTARYISNVSNWLGINPSAPLRSVSSQAADAMSFDFEAFPELYPDEGGESEVSWGLWATVLAGGVGLYFLLR